MKPEEIDSFAFLTDEEKAFQKLAMEELWQHYDEASLEVERDQLRDEIREFGQVLRKPGGALIYARIGTSFTAKRINATTFVIREDDAYGEHPLIYAKLYPKAGVIVLSDTGCDEPSEKHKEDKYIHLRHYLEDYPIADYGNNPLNLNGHLKYIIICTHCHYDHILGIPQFLEGGTTEIIASAAGRDFIESDLETHGIFKYIDRPAPYYQVTKWAQAFERLRYPFEHDWDERAVSLTARQGRDVPIPCWLQKSHALPLHDRQRLHRTVSTPITRPPESAAHPPNAPSEDQTLGSLRSNAPDLRFSPAEVLNNFDFDAFLSPDPPTWATPAHHPTPSPSAPKVDLGITIIHTPGHTPDELAWYDHEEMHLYVGDSFYREGDEDGMPIIFPGEGSLVEWVFSMQKLAVFVRGENARAAAAAAAEAASRTEGGDGDGNGGSSDEDGWVHVSQSSPHPRRVQVSCAHQTSSVDGATILAELEAFSFRVFIGEVPVVASKVWHGGQVYDTWRESGEDRVRISLLAPRRLMEGARRFFGNEVASV